MILLIAAALLGSLVGLVVRNGFSALFLSVALTAFFQFSAMVFVQMLAIRPDHAILAQQLQAIVGTQLIGLAPNMVAAGAAAALSALILAKAKKADDTSFWLPGDESAASSRHKSKRVRHGALVEDRAIHDDARTRMNRIMRR